MIPFPDKKYQIIYADPPWQYHLRTDNTGVSQKHYPSMELNELLNMPVCDLADTDCLLFMWATNPCLEEAMQVGKTWGFEYKTVGFVWYKKSAVVSFYTMSQCELCLIFKKGKIPQPRGARNIRQFLSVKRSKHSAKPPQVRDAIKEMFPDQDKIELFARKPKDVLFPDPSFDGWDVWGNEA